MGEKLADAVIYLTTDDTKLRQGFNQAEQQSRGFGSRVGGVLKGALAAGAIGATAAIGGLAFAMRDSVGLAKQQIEVEKQLDAVLASTKNAAGLTAEEIKAMASELQGVTNFGDEATLAGQNMLLTFTNIGKDVFPTATETMLNMSQAMGQDIKTSAIQLGKALNDPIAGVASLTRVGVQFTDQQKEQIAAMMEAGDVAGAQSVILKELETQFGGSARALADPAIQLQNAWGDFKEEVGKAIIPLLNDLAKNVLPLVIKAITWFGAEGVPAIAAFGEKVKAVINFIVPLFQNLRDRLDNDVTGRFEYFKNWIDTNLPLVQTLVENIMNAMTKFWTEHGEAIMVVVKDAFEIIKVTIDTVLKTVLDLVTFALQVLTGDWEAAGETMVGIVVRIWDAIKLIFQAQINSIKTIFSEFDWAEIGRSMMDGIAGGITGGAERVKDAAKNAAQSALESAKSLLGIRSPSQVAERQIGVPFAEGIAEGIQSGLQNMGNALNGGFGNLMGGQAAAAGVGSQYVITVNLTNGGYEEGRQVGRGVVDELRLRGL